MRTTRTVRGGLALALLLLAPGLAAAQSPNARLYEVTEAMKIKGGATGRRTATAALIGSVDPETPVCPGSSPCAIIALATDNLSLATRKGPVTGSFKIVVQEDPASVDAPEQVIMNGRLAGQIDLSPLIAGLPGLPPPVPLGFLVGRWSAVGAPGGSLAGVRVHGTLSGTFRLPFEVTIPGVGPVAYYLLDNGSPVPVAQAEHSLGVPTVKLEILFVEEP